jgi:hypothetical protein
MVHPMRIVSATATLCLTAALTAATARIQAQDCASPSLFRPAGMAPGAKLSKQQKDSIDAVLNARIVGNGEVLVVATASPVLVQTRLAELWEQCQLGPVTWNTPGELRAKLPREAGMLAQYEITVQARIAKGTDGTRLRMYADEITISEGKASAPRRITTSNLGRSRATLLSLTAIAHAIAMDENLNRSVASTASTAAPAPAASQPPAAAAAAAPASGGESFVGNAASRVYFLKGCQASKSIQPENLVVFAAKAEAVAAGYARSGAPGC